MDVAQQQFNIHDPSLDVALFSSSSDEVSRFYFVVLDEFALVIDKSQVVKRLDILRFRC